ncbi:MAG: hypothetical protein QMD86_02255 [Patescibacteria group bacterium]|nr:hypothetical protein [Patescibacteria group bacterium]
MKFNKEFFKEHAGLSENGQEKISEFLEKISENLNLKGVPVKKDCRIDIDKYSEVYSDIEEDKQLLKKHKQQWFPGLSEKRITEEKSEKIGEQLEILITVLFSKFLGENYIVARTSEYDDIKNGIDNIIFSKETGNLVCAFDEVADTSHKDYEIKIGNILKKNTAGGGKLKYGINSEKGKISLGKSESAPIFYLALPQHLINEGIKNFNPNFEEKSDYEKKLFKYFISSIHNQYRLLKLEPKLNPVIKKKLEIFKKVIDEFSESLQ